MRSNDFALRREGIRCSNCACCENLHILADKQQDMLVVDKSATHSAGSEACHAECGQQPRVSLNNMSRRKNITPWKGPLTNVSVLHCVFTSGPFRGAINNKMRNSINVCTNQQHVLYAACARDCKIAMNYSSSRPSKVAAHFAIDYCAKP